MEAPVFALPGYAAASQGISRGVAVPRCGMAQGRKMCRWGMRGFLMAAGFACCGGVALAWELWDL